jgi:hypothetical protein
VTFAWDDSDQPNGGWEQVETAVGVLMELCGWATTARSRLITAAVIVDTPVETIATALLALGPEHPAR